MSTAWRPPDDENDALASSMYVAARRPPGQAWAKVVQGGDQTGLGTGIVQRNLPSVDAMLHENDPTPEAIRQQAPALASWMEDPDNATIAKGEVPALARVDKGARALAAPSSGFFGAIPQGYNDLAASVGLLGAAFGGISPETAAAFVARHNARAAQLRASAPQYAKDYESAQSAASSRDAILQALAPATDNVSLLGDVLDQIAIAARHPRGFARQLLEGTVSSAPALVGGLAGGATGGPIGLAAGTFAGFAPTAVGQQVNAQLQKRGVDVTDPSALAAAFRDPAIMAGIRAKAAEKGLTSAAVSAIVAAFAGQFTSAAKVAGATGTDLLAARVKDVAVQAAGQAAAPAVGDVASGQPVNVDEAIQSGISQLGFALGETALGTSFRALHHPETATAAAEVVDHATDALRAQHDAQVLHELGQAVQESPATASVPGRLQQLVEAASGGEDASHVYFQTDDWDAYWSKHDIQPATAAETILNDGGRAYDAAKASGAPFAIPLGEYVSKVATAPAHYEGLLPIARTQPDGASLAEAREYLQALPGTMRDLAAEASQQTPAPETQPVASIGQHVESQLLRVGLTPSAAKAQSTLYESAFRTMAERVGLDPLELYNRYNLTISKGVASDRMAQAAESARQAREALGADWKPTLSDEANAARLEQEEIADPTLQGETYKAPRPRTASGRLKSLRTATDEELGNEYRTLIDANAEENVAATVTGAHESPDQLHVSQREGAVRAAGRVAARAKTIAKLEAEFKARGIDAGDAYQRAYQDHLAASSPTAFPFGELSQSGKNATPRGRITLGDSKISIELLQRADRSTFLHETGHFYLKLLDDLASQPDAPAELKGDRATIREWLGVQDGEEFSREQHEQFARGFEAYLMEGKAPSQALRGVFLRFKNWLIGVYKQATNLHVKLSDDVRGVFARMLASKEEIAAAEPAVRPLFDDPAAVGMNPETAQKYAEVVAEHRQAAEEELTARMMRQIRREESAEWKKLREPIQAEATREIDASPLYRAKALIEDGTNPDGSELPEGLEPFKLSREEVATVIGKDAADALPSKLFGKDGVHPDVAADLFGYSDARTFLEELAAAPDRDEAIRIATDAEMQMQHGERMTDEELHDAAARTVFSKKREQVLRMELQQLASKDLATLKGLTKATTRRVTPPAEVQAEAARLVGQMAMKEIRPYLLELAARRAGTEARDALLKGDVEGAFRAKSKELLATAIHQAAVAAKDAESDALAEFTKTFRSDAKLAPTREMSLVNAARAILSSFGIGKADKPASEYLRALQQYEPDTYAAIEPLVADATASAQQAGGRWEQLPYGDFQNLRETVKALWNLARANKQIEIDGVKLDKDVVVGELAARADVLKGPKEQAGLHRALTGWDRAKVGLMGFRAAVRRVEHWARAIDAGDEQGAYRRYLWNPIAKAAADYRVRRNVELQRYAAMASELDGLMRHEEIHSPELAYTFKGTSEVLGAMLHSGNGSNLSKLLRGRGWGSEDENGVLDRSRWDAFVSRMQSEGVLTKAHYDYLQRVWDLFDALKGEAQKAHRAMYGYYFDELTAQPFATPFGDYRGGYFPAKADPFLTTDSAIREEKDVLEHGNNSFMFPTTGRGFTKARVEAYAKPLIIDAQMVPTHIDAVLRFAHIEPRIKEVGRVVMDRRFTDALDQLDQTVRGDMLVPWLQRTARQAIDTPMTGAFGRFINSSARLLRARAGLQMMAVNMTVAAEQITHFPAVLLRVKPVALADGLWEYITNGHELVENIHNASDYMRTRETAGMMEARKAIDDIMLDKSAGRKASDWFIEHANFLARGIQHVMDHATWRAAYSDAIEGGEAHADAVRHADSAVRETLGAYEPENLSRFETGSPLMRLFSMFYSFYNTKANLLATEYAATMRSMGLRKGAGRLAFAYAMGFMLPAALGMGIKQYLGGGRKPSDDDSEWDNLFHLFAGGQAEMAARMVPVVGPLAEAAFDFTRHEKPDILSSPAITALEESVNVPLDVYHAIKDKLTRGEITDFFTLMGMLTGAPLAPLAKPTGYLHDLHTGKARSSGAADFLRGLTTGKPKQTASLPAGRAPTFASTRASGPSRGAAPYIDRPA